MRSNVQGLWTTCAEALALVVAVAGASTGCGGKSPNPGDNQKEPNREIECVGVLTDPKQPQDSVDFPTPASPPPLACVAKTATDSDIVAKCQSKCDGSRDQYAAFIDQQDDLTGPDNKIVADDLVCQITQTVPQVTSQGPQGCPDLDPPGIPEPLLAGGPSQYAASVSGQLSLAVDTGTILGTVNFEGIPISGSFAYSIAPIDLNCPATGCQLLVTSLRLHSPSFTISVSAPIIGTLFSDSVSDLTVQSVEWMTGTWFPDGHFAIPKSVARAVVNLVDNGGLANFDQTSDHDITGTIDPASGAVTFDPVSEHLSDTTATVSSLGGSNVSAPPVAVITAPSQVECSQPNAAVITLDGTASTSALGGPLRFYSWKVNGGPTLGGQTVQATLNLGANSVLFNVFNATLGVGVARKTITVVDTTPPAFASMPATIEQAVCDSSTQPVVIPIPAATDICSPTVNVVGQITAKNGVALSPAIAVGAGSLSLPPGVYTVQWTATDPSGNVSTTTQTLTVRPGIEGNDFVSIDDGASVVLPGGAAAAIGNTGTGQVTVGVQAETGNIVTDGSVFLRSRAIVQGNIQAAGALTEQSPVTVGGTVTTGAPVSLPPGPSLASVVFPSPLGAAVDLEPNVSRSLAPGAYSSIAVKPGATLTLSTGTYFVGALDLESNAHVNLDQAAGPIQVLVQSSIIDRAQIATIAGSASGFVLAYTGTATVFVQSPFPGGTIIAPDAEVVIASLGANAYTGQLFAQSIEVQPGARVVCSAAAASAQHGSFAARLRYDGAPAGSRPADTGGCSVSAVGDRRGGIAAIAIVLAVAAVIRRRSRSKRVAAS